MEEGSFVEEEVLSLLSYTDKGRWGLLLVHCSIFYYTARFRHQQRRPY